MLIGGGVYAGIHFHVIHAPSVSLSKVTSKFTSLQSKSKPLAEIEGSSPHPSPQMGKVAGIATEKLSGIGSALSSFVTTGSDSAQVTIDVQKISDQIGSQMEKLPAQLVEKAKVAYCQQVLIEATRSATSH